MLNLCALPTLSDFLGQCLTRPYKKAAIKGLVVKRIPPSDGKYGKFLFIFSLPFFVISSCPFSRVPCAAGGPTGITGEMRWDVRLFQRCMKIVD